MIHEIPNPIKQLKSCAEKIPEIAVNLYPRLTNAVIER